MRYILFIDNCEWCRPVSLCEFVLESLRNGAVATTVEILFKIAEGKPDNTFRLIDLPTPESLTGDAS